MLHAARDREATSRIDTIMTDETTTRRNIPVRVRVILVLFLLYLFLVG